MFSRRHFLQLAGIAVAAQHLPSLNISDTAPSFDPIYGRALASTPVYIAPDPASPVIKQMWSDTVAPIIAVEGDWYRLHRGYVQHQHLQPMTERAQPSEEHIAPPAWAEVCGSIAVVREWCAVSAPVVTRIGHGGVLCVIDRLSGEGTGDWYGVAASENGALLGWTFASVWSPIQVDEVVSNLTLAVDKQAQQMTIRRGQDTLLTAPISTGRDLSAGVYPITARKMNLSLPDHAGAPWALRFGDDLHLTGVYWHNRFGVETPGAALQGATSLVRWLYPRAAKVIIS